VKHKKRGDNVHEVQLYSEAYKRGDNIHEVQLCVVKDKKEVTMYMRAVLHVHCHLFLYFTTHSCTSCTLSPLFLGFTTKLYFMYIVTSFLCFTTVLYFMDNVHEVQLCVVKHKKDVTMYMKYSFVVKHKKEVTMYMKYSSM
jgi:hypothetical protein